MIVKRIENFEGTEVVKYLQEDGTFGAMETARRFETEEDAQDRIDLEKDDPKYDKTYMGECRFEVVK